MNNGKVTDRALLQAFNLGKRGNTQDRGTLSFLVRRSGHIPPEPEEIRMALSDESGQILVNESGQVLTQ
jgi:hypothetical protein